MLSNRLEENIILFNNIISISKDTESKNYAGTYAIRATSLYILFFCLFIVLGLFVLSAVGLEWDKGSNNFLFFFGLLAPDYTYFDRIITFFCLWEKSISSR